jgi:Outer membrane protein beta-barrel domain
MRKLLITVSFLLALPLVALAQDAPKVEVFGGYSYLNPNGGDDLNGWNASVTGNINKWFGIKSDFSGYYTSYNTVGGAKVRVSDHFFLAGGQFTYRGNDRVQPFAHLMAGTVLLRSRTTRNCPANSLTCLSQVKISDSGFALVAGGGVDLKIAKHLALRLIQADYVYVRNNGFNDHGFRLSTGLVGRAGEQ